VARKTRSMTLARLGSEAFVISVGVLIALVADDWRESHSERQAARAGLELVLGDLESDAGEFARQSRSSQRLAGSAAWLIRVWDHPTAATDSLEQAFYRLGLGTSLELSRAAFEGLRDSNRLRSIESDSLRAEIAAYYQVVQPALAKRYEFNFDRVSSLLFSIMPRHVEDIEGESPERLWPPLESSVRLRQPWVEIVKDPQLRTELVWVGRLNAFYVTQVAGAEIRAASLVRSIESHLGR